MVHKRHMMEVLLLFFLATITVARSNGYHVEIPHQIHLLRPQTGAGGHHVHGSSCLSWRLGVETNNIIGWTTVPQACEGYVGHYMLGHQYRKDWKVVANAACLYAQGLNLTGDGKDIWVFDVDETSLSNLPYFADHGFGAEAHNSTLANEWVLTGKAQAMPESLKLYQKLLSLGIKVVFLTGRSEDLRNVTETNLKKVGFHTWEKLILRPSSESGTPYRAVVYKSSKRKELEAKGYRIVGNIGDQWSDLLGTHVGNRTFKAPNPVY